MRMATSAAHCQLVGLQATEPCQMRLYAAAMSTTRVYVAEPLIATKLGKLD